MNWYLEPWKKYADFSGRACRREYWIFTFGNSLIGMAVALPLMLLLPLLASNGGNPPSWPFALAVLLLFPFSLALVIPSLAVSIRRLHDANLSGWFYLVGFIPCGGLFLFILMLLPGTAGDNNYGPDPRP